MTPYIEPNELNQIQIKNFPIGEINIIDLDLKLGDWHHNDHEHKSIKKHIIHNYSTQGKKDLNDFIQYDKWVPHTHTMNYCFTGLPIGDPITCPLGFPITQLCQFTVTGNYIRPDNTTYEDGIVYSNENKNMDLRLTHRGFEHFPENNKSYQIVNMYVNDTHPIGSYTIKTIPLPHYNKITTEWKDDDIAPFSTRYYNVMVDAVSPTVKQVEDFLFLKQIFLPDVPDVFKKSILFYCQINKNIMRGIIRENDCLIREDEVEKQDHIRLPFYKWHNWLIPHSGRSYR